MFRSLVPDRQENVSNDISVALPSLQGCRPVPAGEISRCLADLSRSLSKNGRLGLLLSGCLAPAAPFVLFRLKREGYSNCIVTATADGLRVEADR